MYKILSWIVVLLGMIIIFNLSSQPAEQSDQLSTIITESIAKIIEKVVPGADFDLRSFNNLLRKYAHFFAYLILGAMVFNALRRSGLPGHQGVILALLICVLFAVSDEIHQLFVPGRGGELRDVIIDSAGAGIGIGLYWVRAFKNKW